MKKIIWLAAILILTNCQNKDSQIKVTNYYDLEGLLKQQIQKLKTLNPTINKTAFINQKQENKIYKIEKWEKELAFFLQTDINKKSLKNSYTIHEVSPKSTQKIITYTAKEAHLTIRELKLTFDNTQLIDLVAHLSTENYLYDTKKILKMNFTDVDKQHLIKSYMIEGDQSLIFLQKNSYKVNVILNY